MKQKKNARVLSQREIAPLIFDMWIDTDLSLQAVPGQFICIYPKDKSTLLPRPISICEADRERRALRVVYRVAGQGTEEFSRYRTGDTIAVMGTLGNGFPLDEAVGKKVFLMGGGIGIPPMLELAKRLAMAKGMAMAEGLAMAEGMAMADIRIILGYRDRNLFLHEDLEKYGQVFIATEDGSAGTKGNVMDAIAAGGLEADIIFSCGPMPMLRAIKQYAAEKGIKAYLSLEERMACGVGACLGCVADTKEKDHHSHVNNARICTDGPVFEAGTVKV